MIKDKKSNKEQSCNVKCISMKNMKSMEVCNKTVSTGDINICGTHKKRKLLYLSDGTILKNIENQIVSDLRPPPLKIVRGYRLVLVVNLYIDNYYMESQF